MEWDEDEEWCKSKGMQKRFHLKKLVTTINSCGVTFSICEKRNADSKGCGTYDWTSLMRNEKTKLLSTLPDKLKDVIQNETVKDIQKLWKDFECQHHGFIRSWNPSSATEYNNRIRERINLFTGLGDKRHGYKVENVTCYMHAAAYHLSKMVQQHHNLKSLVLKVLKVTTTVLDV
ncbi:uncharacterized protein LOC114974355 [Acropora millepora]|uniref:uncharacterized protein LOC114974355 n=1 Tax=Acropora millepora TaxID=45264 RepID=UPI001CF5C476|nr:uncharacterized protein LOC114974355 [Acropora millepora]